MKKTSLKKPVSAKKPAAKKVATKKPAATKPKAQKPQGQQGELFKRLADAVEKLERVAERLAGASGRTLHAQDEAIEATTVREDEAPELTDVREAGKHD